MNFEDYYNATEEAFVQEKEDILYKIEKLKGYWTETSELNEETVQKCKEMLKLKKMISKGHLQILRTREECLHMQLRNSQLRFHVRQLQSEIFRLLPYSHTDVPSTEYHMSLDREVFRAPVHAKQSEADESHLTDLKQIHKKWIDLCDQQEVVFVEEKLHFEEDDEQWRKFIHSYEIQNYHTHQTIDSILNDITKRYIALKSSNEELVKTSHDTIENLSKKLKRLKNKSESTINNLTAKKDLDKNKASSEAAKMTKELRRRVKTIEIKNQATIETLQEENAELQEQEDDLLDSIDDLKSKITTLDQKNKSILEEGEKKLNNLLSQLNALVTAATALKECPNEEESKILNAVATAVGKHGKSALSTEQIKQLIYLNSNK